MNVAKSSLKVLISKIITSLTGFVAVIVFSRELGASPLGTYYPFLALLGIITIPADFGICSAVEKRLSEGNNNKGFLSTAIVLKIIPLVIISFLILLIDDYINLYLGANLAVPLVVTLFIREGARLALFTLRGELRVGETAVIEVLRPLGWLIVGYIFYSQGYGVHGLVYGYIVGTVGMLLVGWWKISTPFSRPTVFHARSLIDYSRYSVISRIGGYFYSWMDVAILTLFVSMGIISTRGAIGAYENAWRVSLVVLILSQAIATAIFPQVSRWDAEDAIKKIEAIIPTALLPAVLFVIPAFIGTIVLSKDILRILFGPEFTVAWLALIILMGEKVLQAIHIILGRSLQGIDRPDLAAYVAVISATVNLVLNLGLIWQFGIAGAALATAISFALNTGLHAYYLNKFIDIDFPLHEAVWSVFASICMGIVVSWVHSVVVVQTMIHLLSIILFGAIVFASIVLIYAPLRSRVRVIVDSVLKRGLIRST